MRVEEKIYEVKKFVEKEFEDKRRRGLLSLAHDISHVYSVANASSLIARYLARREGLKGIEDDLAYLSELAGLLHDIKRDVKEEIPHSQLGEEYILKSEELASLISYEERQILSHVIGVHEKSYSEVSRILSYNPIESIVARALVVADKLFEASGPRALERRSFFVGKERILNGDLKGKFRFPDESYLSVLGEGLRRIYGINHVRNYPEELKPLVDELHSWQYEFDYGLLAKAKINKKIDRIDETDAYKYFESLGFPKIEDVRDSIKEKHLGGKYLKKDEYPIIVKTIENILNENIEHIGEDAYRLVYEIVISETPDEFVERMNDILPEGYYGKWIDGIVNYRKGIFFYQLGDKLISS